MNQYWIQLPYVHIMGGWMGGGGVPNSVFNKQNLCLFVKYQLN